jgi:ABC-2 type transport system ATP-binding protein
MIEAEGLTRCYGEFTAVDNLTFTINEGEIVGMLGPNGAGKTTTLRMITGFLPPTKGRLTVAGRDLFTDSVGARREVGYLPENVALYSEMRVSEYLWYRSMLEGMNRADANRRIPEAVRSCILGEVQDQIIGTLSKGYRQRVGLASAILHHPKVLVLDEPTVGLDPKQIIAIRELIRELGKEQTLLISSHILPEVELLCDRVIILDRGQIIAEGSPEDLQASWVGNTIVRVELKGEPQGAAEIFGQIEGVAAVTRAEGRVGRFVLECDAKSDIREEVFRAALSNGWTLLELTEQRASLEDVFVRLTTLEDSPLIDSPTEPSSAEQVSP